MARGVTGFGGVLPLLSATEVAKSCATSIFAYYPPERQNKTIGTSGHSDKVPRSRLFNKKPSGGYRITVFVRQIGRQYSVVSFIIRLRQATRKVRAQDGYKYIPSTAYAVDQHPWLQYSSGLVRLTDRARKGRAIRRRTPPLDRVRGRLKVRVSSGRTSNTTVEKRPSHCPAVASLVIGALRVRPRFSSAQHTQHLLPHPPNPPSPRHTRRLQHPTSQYCTMSDLGQVANATGAVGDKPEFQTSSIDVSKTSKIKDSFDGIEDGDPADDVYSRANPSRPGFTKNDQKDMYRMGKLQEFKVCCAWIRWMGDEACNGQWWLTCIG
jgi:hypothetical protein